MVFLNGESTRNVNSVFYHVLSWFTIEILNSEIKIEELKILFPCLLKGLQGISLNSSHPLS